MSLSCCSCRRDRTRHASAVRLSFLLFSAERFPPSKIAPLKVSIAAEKTSLPCSACLPIYAYADPESVRRRCRFFHPLLLASYASVVQVLYAPFQAFVDALLALLLLYYHPLFSHLHFVLYYLGYCFTCYRSTLCSITSRSFEISPSTATFFVHSFHMVTSPPLRPLVSDFISFFRFTCCLIAFYVSCLEAPLDLCDFAFEALTS